MTHPSGQVFLVLLTWQALLVCWWWFEINLKFYTMCSSWGSFSSGSSCLNPTSALPAHAPWGFQVSARVLSLSASPRPRWRSVLLTSTGTIFSSSQHFFPLTSTELCDGKESPVYWCQETGAALLCLFPAGRQQNNRRNVELGLILDTKLLKFLVGGH